MNRLGQTYNDAQDLDVKSPRNFDVNIYKKVEIFDVNIYMCFK